MDGKFVENKCLPFELVEKIKNNVNILLDIHLMVDDVVGFVKHFALVKPSIITILYEAPKSTREILKVIKYLKKRDILVGLSIKPNTPIEIIERFLDYIDLILIMSVEPGKSGQKFIDDTYEKVKKAKELIKGKDILIEVDGGINIEIAQKLKKLGCDFLVMGSAFYNEKEKSKLLNSIDKHYKLT
jgi:ribulose-phosphate 3-epimerase